MEGREGTLRIIAVNPVLGIGGCPVSSSYFFDFTDNKTAWLVGAGALMAGSLRLLVVALRLESRSPARSHSLTPAGLIIYLYLAVFLI